MFADIGFGIVIAIIAAGQFAVPLDTRLLLAGIVFVLLPDLDALIHVVLGKHMRSKFSHEHRTILHYPTVYLVVGSLLITPFGLLPLFLFMAGSLVHFMHDAIGIGWGVKLLWPFSKMNFSLYQVDTGNWFFWKTDREIKDIASRYGKDDWIRYYYFRPTVISIVENAIFIVSLVILWIATR